MTEASNNRLLGCDPRIFTSDPVELAYINALADGLEQVLDGGAETLETIVTGLNQRHVTTKSGGAWTEETLSAELYRLGQ